MFTKKKKIGRLTLISKQTHVYRFYFQYLVLKNSLLKQFSNRFIPICDKNQNLSGKLLKNVYPRLGFDSKDGKSFRFATSEY